MQQSWVKCYRCHIIGHIARNCRTMLPSQKIQVIDRQNPLKPMTIAEKAIWRIKKIFVGASCFESTKKEDILDS